MENENIVKKTCKELGITQKELAERMGVTETSVTNWARGATPVPTWASRIFELLKKEKDLNTILEIVLKYKKI